MRNFVKAALFITISCISIMIVTKVLIYEHEMEPGRIMTEFYSLKDNEVEMFVVGSSHTELGFSPIEMYKNTKITSYNFSTAKQPVELSYHLVLEGMKTQKPKLVMMDVASLFYTDRDVSTARLRYVMDSMPLSLNKYHLARVYAHYNKKEEEVFSIAEALCPTYYYHDRWKNLTEDDFDINPPNTNLKGQFIRTYIAEMEYDPEQIEKNLANKVEFNADAAPKISEYNKSYLYKLKELCEDNGAKLLLITTPTTRWNSIKAKTIQDVCDEIDCNFVDLNMPDGELLDYSVDMADENHVNASGVIKTTKYLTDYITKNYDLESKEVEDYEKSIKYYDGYYEVLNYQLETDFGRYLELLNKNKDHLTIFLAGKTEMMDGLTDEDKAALAKLGCKTDFSSDLKSYSFGTVIDSGKNIFEAVRKKEVVRTNKISDGTSFKITSQGYYAGRKASVLVDGKEWATNGRGLNIVVYDNNSKTVIDTVAFDTSVKERKWYRGEEKNTEITMFLNYRNWVLEDN